MMWAGLAPTSAISLKCTRPASAPSRAVSAALLRAEPQDRLGRRHALPDEGQRAVEELVHPRVQQGLVAELVHRHDPAHATAPATMGFEKGARWRPPPPPPGA